MYHLYSVYVIDFIHLPIFFSTNVAPVLTALCPQRPLTFFLL